MQVKFDKIMKMKVLLQKGWYFRDMESNGYDKRIAEKANAPLARKLQNLIPDSDTANKLKDYLGVSIQAINQYKLGTAFPKTENLIKIAEFFGISVDYLLGITNSPNRDSRIQSVCDYTGLSTSAVEVLKKLNDKSDSRAYIDLLSLIISDENFEWILGIMESYFEDKTISNTLSMSRVDINQKDYTTYCIGVGIKHILDRIEGTFKNNFLSTDERLDIIFEKRASDMEERGKE